MADTQPTVDTSAPDAPAGDASDAARMDAILNEVLAEGEAASAAEAKPQEAPADKPAADAEPATETKPADAPADETPQDAQLRKGFAKLAQEKERLLTLQNEARTAIQTAKQYEDKAKQFDALSAELDGDVAALVLKRGGPEAIKKLLDDVVALEKSPAERRLDALERERKAELEQQKQAEQRRQVETWHRSVVDHITGKGEAYDLINTLGQHAAVIEMITQHYAANNGAILDIDVAARALEETLAGSLSKSKKFGPRGAAPAAKPVATAPSKGTPAPKQTGATSLSSVHASEIPATQGADDLPLDDKQRFDKVLAELGFA